MRMRPGYICYALFAAAVLMGLMQMWFQIWNGDLFLKMMLTIAAVFVLVLILAYMMKEDRDEKKFTNKELK